MHQAVLYNGNMSESDPTPDIQIAEVRRRFGEALRKLRAENGISQQKIADAIEVSVQAVSQWETGKSFPDYIKLLMLSSFLKVDIGQLFNGGTPSSYSFYNELGRRVVRCVHLSKAYHFFFKTAGEPIDEMRSIDVVPTYPTKDALIGLEIDDDSMSPIFSIGDIIIINTKLFPLPGDFVVYQDNKNERWTLRKFKYRYNENSSENFIEYHPENADYPIAVARDHLEMFIHGTVVEHRRYRRR